MLNIRIVILSIFYLIPLQTLAQGVPKAYESVTYRASMKGRPLTLVLANGYIAASSIKMLPNTAGRVIVFEPDAGTEDQNNRLKFIPIPTGRQDYFIMDNMQSAYEEIPAYLAGKYYLDHQIIPVKFQLVKKRKH